MPIVLAAPVTAPTIENLFRGNPMAWVGVDGRKWDFTATSTPLMAKGVQGLHNPPMTIFKSSSALVHGKEPLGYSIDERPVYWPLIFKASSTAEWRDAYDGFFSGLHPITPGMWAVGEGESERTLPLTGTFTDSYEFGFDPFVTGFALIGIELTANSPLWRGKPVTQTFGAADGVDFIDSSKAPEFHISPAGTFSSASITNVGDEPAYPRWTVEGPLDTVQLGIGDALIRVPFPITAGSKLVIDTDPTSQLATLNNVNCTRELGFQSFAPVPPKGTTTLTILAAGTGVVTVSLTPLFWRAF